MIINQTRKPIWIWFDTTKDTTSRLIQNSSSLSKVSKVWFIFDIKHYWNICQRKKSVKIGSKSDSYRFVSCLIWRISCIQHVECVVVDIGNGDDMRSLNVVTSWPDDTTLLTCHISRQQCRKKQGSDLIIGSIDSTTLSSFTRECINVRTTTQNKYRIET